MVATACSIAGSDPSGGAGIQADLKTFHQHSVYGMAAITLLTAQSTQTVRAVELTSARMLDLQLATLFEDIVPDAAKTGALGSAELIRIVARHVRFPLVVDPVMISKHGAPLIADEAVDALMTELAPRATLLTPNTPEAERMTGMTIRSLADARAAAKRLLARGTLAVLVKGGHLPGEPIDVLATATELIELRSRRIDTVHTHGTGCSYSAAITARLARGESLVSAVEHAKRWIERAIASAPGIGKGHGPINHFAAGGEPST